ncbi:MAG: hypothetical protein WC595_02395 [Candidatus Nanoarchaeia archaeon]
MEDTSYPGRYEKHIKTGGFFGSSGCNADLIDQVEGLFCNNYPELANLDGNPAYSEQEKEVTRAIQLYNNKISGLYYHLNLVHWMLVVLTIIFCINLVYDIKSKK